MPADPSIAELRPAATVVVLRDGGRGPEVFMVRRHERAVFMGGAHVFPGGGVDEADRGTADRRWCDGLDEAERRIAGVEAAEAVAFHVAAIRELFEEAGVLLARDAAGRFASQVADVDRARYLDHRQRLHAGSRTLHDIADCERLRLALDALVPFAHWVTPPLDVRRFDTRFFAVRLPAGQTPEHDDRETTHGTWMTAADAIVRCERDDIALPVPTWTTLREIEPFGSVDDVLAWARTRRIVRREPKPVEHEGQRIQVLPGDPLSSEAAADTSPAETRFVFLNGRWRAHRARPSR